MKFEKQFSDELVLAELGQRLMQIRLSQNLTQTEVAAQARVSKHTVERFEAGESIQLTNLIRLCRALGLIENFDKLIPELPLSPIAQLKMRGKVRRRASSAKTTDESLWSWGDKS